MPARIRAENDLDDWPDARSIRWQMTRDPPVADCFGPGRPLSLSYGSLFFASDSTALTQSVQQLGRSVGQPVMKQPVQRTR